MSTIEEPHKVGNGGRFVCGCLPFVNSTPAASRAATIFSPCPPAVDDRLARSHGQRPNCWRNWVLRVRPWEDGIADDVLESVAVDFVAMRAAGAV
jgi:hypothetical protein